MKSKAVLLRKRIASSLRTLSRAIPIGDKTRASIRSRVLRVLGWIMPSWGLPGSPAVSIAPRPGEAGVADYFLWGLMDWHFRIQRPQHLSRGLVAAGRRVFFISSRLIDSADPGFRVEPLDESGRLFQVFFNVRGIPSIYYGLPAPKAAHQLQVGLASLVEWATPSSPISLVEHPFWSATARAFSGSRLVYDRMDYHQGFGTFAGDVSLEEQNLMRDADLTVVSSEWLDRDSARYTQRRVIIRNAADYAHFSAEPDEVFRDRCERRVIGYYGSIADWMDLDLVAAVARRYPDCLLVLIGHDQAGAARRLSGIKNIQLLGEVPYSELPYYLHGFDVCLLPRRVSPLTEAMNPVKLYEYLSAGRPVAAVNLPELRQFADLVYSASNEDEFLDAVGTALAESVEDPITAKRAAFAAEQSWRERADSLIAATESLPTPPGGRSGN